VSGLVRAVLPFPPDVPFHSALEKLLKERKADDRLKKANLIVSTVFHRDVGFLFGTRDLRTNKLVPSPVLEASSIGRAAAGMSGSTVRYSTTNRRREPLHSFAWH
jgi:hypothetical protein